MNKNVRMIDADELKSKLLLKVEELDKRIARRENPSYWDESSNIERFHTEAYGYEQVIKMIDQELAVDPIPLPTIKKYRCGECKSTASAKGWNSETAIYFGRTMPQVDEKGEYSDSFVCPACGEEQPRRVISEVNP